MTEYCQACDGAGMYIGDGELHKCPCGGASTRQCQRAIYETQEWAERILEYGRDIGYGIFYYLEPRFCYDCDGWHIRIREDTG